MTVRKYCDILEGTFMVRILQPWYADVGKRVVKRPKLYLRDSGLFHTLLSIERPEQLFASPKLGASWEGFALDCVCRFKYEDAPRLSRSMQTAIDDLQLAGLWVVYPGNATYALTKNIKVIPRSEVGTTWNY